MSDSRTGYTEGTIRGDFLHSFVSQQRDDRGQFTEEVTLDDVLAVFEAVAGPVVTSGDVAEVTGCSRDSARRKLDELHRQGRVGRRKTAGRVVYWRTEEGGPAPVNPDDPFFVERTTFASGRSDLSERVDEVLYGKDGDG